MEHKLLKQISTLKICIITLVLLNALLLLSSFRNKNGKKERFEEIEAERISIMGTNGKPVMVLSNKRLIPGPAMNGKTYPKEYADGREQFSGIIFFNEAGDEVGGLIYNGYKKDSGYYAMEHLSFDQWKQNQVVAMQYIDNGKSRRAGLRVWDRPDVPMDEILDRFVIKNSVPKNSVSYDSIMKEIKASSARGDNGVERMFIGSQDEVAQIQLRDKKGKVRARLFVDNTGNAKLEFLDEQGSVIDSFPARK
jgi:hypothetical protein